MARACGPVDLDPASLAHLGALKLSNNTAEGQGLAEALLWLAHSSVPRGALVLLRPDSDLVVGWATGQTTAHANLELVSALRAIYTQVAACWRLRWAHVKGHSGHLWNDEADALATRGCQGEVLGFSCGQPVVPAAPPPPLISDTGRYMWLVSRMLTLSLSQAGEACVSSSFVDRHRVGPRELLYVPPGAMLPLQQPPRADPRVELRKAVGRAIVGVEYAFHTRPQAIVFEEGGMDWDDAKAWVLEGLVGRGVGQPVEELKVTLAHGAWAMEGVRCMRAIVDEDVVEATGWLPPSERGEAREDGEAGGEQEEWMEPVEMEPEAVGVGMEAGGEEGKETLEDWGLADNDEGIGIWTLSHGSGVLIRQEGGGVRHVGRAPRPPSPPVSHGEREPGGAPIFWPQRRPIALQSSVESVPVPRPPSPPVSHGERELGGAPMFWPQCCPIASPSAVVSVPAAHATRGFTFAGWDADGREMRRALLPASVCRPKPLRAAEAPPLRPPSPPRPHPPRYVPPRACTDDELGDDDVRAVRIMARGMRWGGAEGSWARMAWGFCHRLLSAASRRLALPSPSGSDTSISGMHEPPD